MSAPATSSDRIEPWVWRIAGDRRSLGSIMSILDTTIVNVALTSLGRELHSSIADIQWVMTGYLLSLAAVIPVAGWAARRFGAKHVYLVSLVLFTRRLGAVRHRHVDDRADRLPRAAGRRRRHDPAGRAADDGVGGGAEPDGTRDEPDLRAGDARADPRPGDRRRDPRRHDLALDLLRQRAGRRDRDRRSRSRGLPRSEPRAAPTGSTCVGLLLLATGIPAITYGLAEIGTTGGFALSTS